jgi:hypothetical protein
MSYLAQAQLEGDVIFQGRVRSCATQQAETFKDDQRLNFVAVAESVLRGESECVLAFVRFSAAGPGIADKVDNGDGTIDQTKVTDADLLSLVQTFWPSIATLFFNEDGTPKV